MCDKTCFFPLCAIPHSELQKTIKLFKWARDNNVTIVHTIDTPKISPPSIQTPGLGPQVLMLKLFLGACKDADRFKKIFGIEYLEENFTKLPAIMEEKLDAYSIT